MTTISPAALSVLSESTLEALTLTLPPRDLERSLYTEVDTILKSLGGKWHKGKRAHIFREDPAVSLALIQETGRFTDVRKDAQFFPTPASVVSTMIEVANLWDGCRALEPSAGMGAIAKALKNDGRAAQIDCCEFLAIHRKALEEAGLNVVSNDFLSYSPERPYDVVLMNPPFALEGDPQAYITHIEHAWGMLRHGGTLVAITPPNWLTGSTKRLTAFRDWVCDFLTFEEIGAGAFKESGTGINTYILYGEKQAESWRRQPHNGWGTQHAWHASLWLENDYDLYQRLRKCEDREAFIALCMSGLDEVRRKHHAPIRLSEADVDELWHHYQED